MPLSNGPEVDSVKPDYQIISVIINPSKSSEDAVAQIALFEKKVNSALAAGYDLVGGPFFIPSAIMQAILKKEG